MMNRNNPNYLLIDEVIPEGYFDPVLSEVSNKIMLEVDELRGTKKYENWIRESGYRMNEENKIIVLYGIMMLFDTEPEAAKRVIEECKLKYKTKKQVEKAYNNRLFDMKVEARKAEAQAINEEKTKKVVTFEDMCISIEEFFPKITIDNDITVKKFIAWENRRKEKTTKNKVA